MRGIIIENEDDQKPLDNTSNINFGILYLGILLLSLGVIYIYGVQNDSGVTFLISFARLWPLALVATGLSFFSAKTTKTLSIGLFITILAVSISIATVLVQHNSAFNRTTESVIPYNFNDKEARINFVGIESNLNVQGGLSQNLAESFYESNYAELDVVTSVDNNLPDISLKQNSFWEGIGSYYKNLTTRLNTNIPFNIKSNSILGNTTMDLSDVLIKNLDISLDASNGSVTLGKVVDDAVISINSQASSFTLIIPKDINVDLTLIGTLTTKTISGLNRETGESRYRSNILVDSSTGEPQEDNRNSITINITSTASRINVIQQ
jgi:hypothetical protein